MLRNRTFTSISRVPGLPESSWRPRAPRKGKVRMENYSTTANANDTEFPLTGASQWEYK